MNSCYSITLGQISYTCKSELRACNQSQLDAEGTDRHGHKY